MENRWIGPPLDEFGVSNFRKNELWIGVEDTVKMWPLSLTWRDLFDVLALVRFCGVGEGVYLEMSGTIMNGESDIELLYIRLDRVPDEADKVVGES